MNKREAKIIALREARQVLEAHLISDALHSNVTGCDLLTGEEVSQKDYSKISAEFDNIIQAIYNRITRLDP